MAPTTVNPRMSVAKNYEGFCDKVVQEILALSKKAIKARGRFNIVLSGGSTPQGIYALMAGPSYGSQFDWNNIHLFLGDERWVPIDSPRSNCKMIIDSLLTNINVPISHFHTIKTHTLNVQVSASLYEKELIRCFSLKPHKFPQFDLILLGLGQDGHTASLFPHQPALEEAEHLAVSVEAEGLAEKRITLTLPVINRARAIFFLVNGVDKASVLKNILEGKEKTLLPAGMIKPQGGEICWFVDQQAASLLEKKYESPDEK